MIRFLHPKTTWIIAFILFFNTGALVRAQNESQNSTQGFNQSISSSGLSQTNLSTINVDQLSDAQIKALLQRAEQSGLTEQQLEDAALARGLPPAELEKLKARIAKIQSGSFSNTSSAKFINRTRTYTNQNPNPGGSNLLITQTAGKNANFSQQNDLFGSLTGMMNLERPEDKNFGFSIFNNKKFTFEPSLNIPTPVNYQLGPGDMIIIDVWGASEQTYQQQISPEGSILINNLGPVYLSGLTVEEASRKIKREFTNIYAGLSGPKPNTYLKVSLGDVKSIKVNVVGDAYVPGTYTLPSLATVFNALYSAGGPDSIGSLRNIKVVRNGKTIATLDFYNYLLKGEQKNNVRLEDQDVIFISPYSERVQIKGEIKRPAFYDLKPSETLKDLIHFAGGPTGDAYTERFKVFRKDGRENKVFDVPSAFADTMKMVNGDVVRVDSVLNRFKNRVQIKGAVYRPGVYSLDSGLTLKRLIKKADGLRGDAFMGQISIYRTKKNLDIEVIPVDLKSFMADSSQDIKLHREDFVVIPSIFDLKEDYTVKIAGEVRKPGTYPFVDNSSLTDLLSRAGGLLESASLSRIEVARRIKNNTATAASDQIAQIFQFAITKDLNVEGKGAHFILQPFDEVFVRRSPGYEEQASVKVSGEVAFPGSYILSDKTERISDIITRAGGLSADAYAKGARLVRKLPVDKKERMSLLKNLASNSKDSIKLDIPVNDESPIGIDLVKILNKPHSDYDLMLQNGDSIIIPKHLETVRLSGAVLYPITVRYDKSTGFRSYISQAGGVAPDGKVSRAYILYANGSVNRTRKILFFRHFPRVEPGAEIIVPQEVEKPRLSPQATIGMATALSSMALIIVTLIQKL